MTVRVESVHIYPVKSLGGVEVATAGVQERGLVGDRRWALVDADGRKVTAREVPRLLGLLAEPLGDGSVRLSDRGPGGGVVVEPPRDAEPVPVDFSGMPTARPAGADVAEWITVRVGVPVRLVWQDDDARRPIRPDLGGEAGEVNSLSDAAPLHVTTDESLARLCDWMLEGDPDAPRLGHDRFRPNLVVSGAPAFAEDGWSQVSLGGVAYRQTMVCDRCVMTMIDRETLDKGKDPVRTLAKHRKWDGATWFGVRLTPVLPVSPHAVVSVGDLLVVG